MSDAIVIGLVAVVAGGSFFAGWMARHARAVTREECLHWRELEDRPVLYDWSTEEDPAEAQEL
jgi:hypothetical protein